MNLRNLIFAHESTSHSIVLMHFHYAHIRMRIDDSRYYYPTLYSLLQAHYRRGESFKIILNMPQLQSSIRAMCGILPNGSGSASEDAFSQVVADFVRCIQMQSVPDPKIFSEATVLAVKYSTLLCVSGT